ncbi:MAG: GTP-binding protein YchF [Microgenomates bacterium 39_7]|nr:MAG: GTP-binding protein YchF [Microgenomates bacterium 39_7]
MSLSIGIVGLPNVGKSTLFNALLKKQVALSANYPFATIEPNLGVVEVPDERLPILAKLVNTNTIKPALVEFTDIAGLIKGASQGEGLGNKFLSHIRETDAICHVLRAFSDENIIKEGSVDPASDLDTVRTELQLADLETLEKQRQPKGIKDKDLLMRWEIVLQLKQRLEEGSLALSRSSASELELEVARELNLLTSKPEIFVLNVDEQDLAESSTIKEKYSALLSTPQQPINTQQLVVISALIESELASLPSEDQTQYLHDLGIEQSGLERLAAVAYRTLDLQSFLTAGELEVKAWTIKRGTNAVEAAGVIHTDFMKKFIKAKVISYDEFVKHEGWAKAKEAGKVRLEGRDYVMQPDDIVEFMIGG